MPCPLGEGDGVGVGLGEGDGLGDGDGVGDGDIAPAPLGAPVSSPPQAARKSVIGRANPPNIALDLRPLFISLGSPHMFEITSRNRLKPS